MTSWKILSPFFFPRCENKEKNESSLEQKGMEMEQFRIEIET